MKLQIEIEISDEAWKWFKTLDEDCYLEYRDPQYESLDDYRFNPQNHGSLSEESFLGRNCGGTFGCALELSTAGLLQDVDMAWHTTFELSVYGKQILNRKE